MGARTNSARMSQSLFAFAGLKGYLGRVGGYFPWVRMGEWSGERAALLRQDVDLDLGAAVRLAGQLGEWSIPSTFFVLMSCPHYNPLSARGRVALREIQAAGCEVGLHFDPTLYPEANAQQLQQWALQEAAMLEQASGRKVKSLSLHNPHQLPDLQLFHGFVNAYDPRIFSEHCYLSDSCRNFRRDPEQFLERVKAQPHSIQILLHPLHYHQQERDYGEIFADYWRQRQQECDADFRKANPTYAREVTP